MNAFPSEAAPREISDVNVVPLADVSLVLLIILLVLSPMMAQSSLRVKTAASSAANARPHAAEDRPLPRPELPLAVGLDQKGLTLGGKSYDAPGAFIVALRDALAGRQDRKVFLAPGPETPHGLVVRAIETIKSCGADSVALVQTQDEPIRAVEATR